MINKRLIGTVSDSKKYIAGNVVCQWISLAANRKIVVIKGVAHCTTPLLKIFIKNILSKVSIK